MEHSFPTTIRRAIRTPRRPENNSPRLLADPPTHPPPFFPLLCLLQDTPSFLEWTTIRRRGTRYLSPADNVKIPEARASFFQTEFRQASLIYEPARARQVTIKHSMSRLHSNGRDSTW